jgi:Putative beta-lactamase-inhibitor-like, PepSY-like
MLTHRWLQLAALTMSLLISMPSRADNAKAAVACPAAVKTAIDKAFPKSTSMICKAEKAQFEVKLTKADGNKVEVDVSADGKILQIEEKIALDKVPAAVMKAFAAKYPKAKVDAAEKQTPATGPASYELAFATDKGRKEATFSEDGKFIEEE